MNRFSNIPKKLLGITIIGILLASSTHSRCQSQIRNNNRTNNYQGKLEESNYPTTNFNISKIAEYDDSLGAMNDIFIQDDLAFVAVKWGGLLIFDISNLEEPTIVGDYYEEPTNMDLGSNSERTSGVFVREDIAFLADGENGLVILNISNPRKPEKVGQFVETSCWRHFFNVVVEGNYAFCMTRVYLIILDITNLFSPQKISEIELYGRDLFVNNGILIVDYANTYIFDITNPR